MFALVTCRHLGCFPCQSLIHDVKSMFMSTSSEVRGLSCTYQWPQGRWKVETQLGTEVELELELVSSYEGKRWEIRREEVSTLVGKKDKHPACVIKQEKRGGSAKD